MQCCLSEPLDVTEPRQSRSPLVSVYLRKTKLKPYVTANATAANHSVSTEEIETAPTAKIPPAKINVFGSRDEVSRPNYALVMAPGQYYGPMLPDLEVNPEEEDNKFFNLAQMLSPPRKPYVPGTLRPNSRPRPNYGNFMGSRPYGYQTGYGLQNGYGPQAGYGSQIGYGPQNGYGLQSAYGPPPDEGYRLGGGFPDGPEENPDAEEEDNKFFNLAEMLSPPRRPYVPGSMRPNNSPRPNYASFLGPRPAYGYGYGQSVYGAQQSAYPYYAGYNEDF